MKKLTAGIFTVLMGLVTVNAAEAAVASKGYVDEKVGGATTAVETLQQTVAANKLAAEKLVSDYKTENDAKVNANTAAIAENAADILANTGLISDNADAIAANTEAINDEKTARETAVSGLDERLVEVEKFSGTGEGSVAKQIADAVAGETSAREAADAELQADIDAINNADTGILKQAQTYADGLATNYDAAGSAAQALADAKTYADTAEADAIAAAAEAAKIYIDADELAASQTVQNSAIETAYKAADKVIADSIGNVAEGKTVVEMIEAAQTAATYDDAEVRGLISDNADAIDAIEASAYATSGITAAKVSAYDAYDAKITANTAAAAAAQETADAAIPAPTGECQDAANKCVLTFNNTEYAWEVIERATDTTLE